jgi:hypothetical protein
VVGLFVGARQRRQLTGTALCYRAGPAYGVYRFQGRMFAADETVA